MQPYKKIHSSYRSGVINNMLLFFFSILESHIFFLLELESFILDVNISHKKDCNKFKLGYVFFIF